jgi:AcrR family transcriptional regulator
MPSRPSVAAAVSPAGPAPTTSTCADWRAEAAEETRRRILDAVYRRLEEAPSQAVSIDQVARIARVARSTIYLIFGSRAGLFDAVARDLLDRGSFDRIVQAVAHPDPRETLRGGIRGTAHMFASHRDVLRALFSMAQLDPEAVGGTIERADRNRAAGMASLAERLAEGGQLRPGVSVEAAADLLWILTSFDAFDLLYSGRGLSADAAADLLVETAERTLCVRCATG